MNLAIVGGGPAGYTAAFEAAKRGLKVTLIEKAHLGGTCLNHGCIPTKTMRASGDALIMARRMAEFGVRGCAGPEIDPGAVLGRMKTVISTLTGGLQKTCANLGVRLMHGDASLAGPRKIRIASGEAVTELDADIILLAPGSRELELPGLPFDHEFILDSSDALELEAYPKRLIIVGGGVIGCELACIFRDFGCEVTIVEGQDRLLPMPSVDTDVSTLLAREMRKRKIRMLTGATLAGYRVENGAVTGEAGPSPFVDADKAASPQTLEADMIFVTVGRAPAVSGLGLEQAGIATDRRGWIQVNDRLETNVPGIYAAGDILGPSHIMLAHVAAMEGMTIIEGLTGGDGRMDYGAVPSAIFTEPEIGCVGLSEAQARAAGEPVACGVAQMRELGKAQAMGALPGFFKIIANADTGRILGIQIMGAHASDILAEATLAISASLRAEDLAHVIHAHPTLAEGIGEAARNIKKGAN